MPDNEVQINYDSTPYHLEDDIFKTQVDYIYKDGALKMSATRSPLITEGNFNKRSGTTNTKIVKEYNYTNGPIPDYLKDRRFCSWGWFEDNILRNFFEMTTGDDKLILQTVKSVKTQKKENMSQAQQVFTKTTEDIPNYCQTSDNLF